MSIELNPEQQRLIDLALRSDANRDASEVVPEQSESGDWMAEASETIAPHLALGFAQAQRGQLIDEVAALELPRKRRADRLTSGR